MPEPAQGDAWYSYAIIRVVPRVERAEAANVGVVLFARTRGFLQAAVTVSEARLSALAPSLDLPQVTRHLAGFVAVAAGDPSAGPVAKLPPSERFHWLTAPRSTVIQTSAVHMGICQDPAATLQYLLDTIVR